MTLKQYEVLDDDGVEILDKLDRCEKMEGRRGRPISKITREYLLTSGDTLDGWLDEIDRNWREHIRSVP